MLDALRKNNVPVVIPKDLMPDYVSENKHIIWGNDTPLTVSGVKFTSLKGNQGDGIPNNVYHMEIDGWTIIDQGDNADHDLELKLAEKPAADLIIAASWNDIQNIFKAAMAPEGASPMFIPSHENEFGHGVDHRESYHELIGRVPGLIISPDGKILIRGISSVNSSNEPLIIVDRIAVPDINVYRPNEVEKVEVLKDASSAIYGVRGANGVILITLKHY